MKLLIAIRSNILSGQYERRASIGKQIQKFITSTEKNCAFLLHLPLDAKVDVFSLGDEGFDKLPTLKVVFENEADDRADSG
jgi:hypothetical protein